MKIGFLILIILSFSSCKKENIIESVSKEYVDYLSTQVDSDFNVFIHEIASEDKRIFRITSGTFNLEKGQIPNDFFKYKEHYVFIFFNNQEVSPKNYISLKKKGLYIEKKSFFTEEDYDEWILTLCSHGKFKVFKNTWYRPLDDLIEVKDWKCKN